MNFVFTKITGKGTLKLLKFMSEKREQKNDGKS